MEPDNDSNFNMIINCEILKNLESFMKCQICEEEEEEIYFSKQ